jgi:alpha-1,3-glucosyltransferase
MKIYPTFVNMEFDFVFISIVTVGFISIRLWIASWDYSGYNKPPIYGDFEAQRHWMEITTSLNIGDWYKFSKLNDLNYWGLDYPPLTAYISWFYGKIAQILFPDLVQFEISRGHQSPFGKLFMRISVLFSDIVILFPSVLLLTNALYYRKSLSLNISNYTKVILLLIFLCCPSLLLIDHGHFQYNGVCIGLTLLAVYAISINRDVLGSILFCLALNFKQMTLYYSPVFFCHLLYKCSRKSSFYSKIIHFLKIGLSVIVTFTILWKPFCLFHHKDETCGSSLLLVLRRIFPFSRGIFEDKVSNIWYGLSVIFDYRDYVTNPQELVPYSVLLTLLLISPIMIDLLLHDADINRFLIALSNSSLGFFLASFQV